MKLVDIDILKGEDICEHCRYKSARCEYTCGENENEIETLWEMIDNLPEVDAKPVIHGMWLAYNYKGDEIGAICSNCQNYCYYLYDYCPICGAKMEGVRSNGTD